MRGVSASQGVRCAAAWRSVWRSRGVAFEIERARVSASELVSFAMSWGGVLQCVVMSRYTVCMAASCRCVICRRIRKVKQSNLRNLARDAWREGVGSYASASNGRWQAEMHTPAAYGSDTRVVGVYHHGTELIRVVFDGDGVATKVIPIDSGWGSTTDRCGVRRITEGAGVSVGYRELFENGGK